MKNLILLICLFFVGSLAFWFFNKSENGVVKGPDSRMSFFITSRNPGDGGNLGGLPGADAFCQKLASGAGITGKTWAAYLSTKDENAKDRIGNGPWFNYKGEVVANNINELHSENNLNKTTALTEKGERVNGRGDTPNVHDILTGSDMMGNFYSTSTDSTCQSWTSNDKGFAMVGHHDRMGINDSAPMKSWTSSHMTRGCSVEAFKATGGGGLFYCFAK